MTGLALAVLGTVVVGMIVARLVANEREHRMRTIGTLGELPEAVNVPRVERDPDPARVEACLQEARVLLASAHGVFRTPVLAQSGKADPSTLDMTALDAVTETRSALALLREAAEREPELDAVFARSGLDPWTEPASLDAIHMRTAAAGTAFDEAAAFVHLLLETVRTWSFGRMPR